MIKVSVMYPNNPGARFDHDYYREKHMPLVKARMGDACKYYTIDKGLAEQYGGGAYDVSAQDAEKGFSAIQEVQADTQRAASIYHLGDYGVKEAAAEVFGGDADAAKKRKKAASAERATFSDSSRGATGSASRTNY